jgi:hypothetical protein
MGEFMSFAETLAAKIRKQIESELHSTSKTNSTTQTFSSLYNSPSDDMSWLGRKWSNHTNPAKARAAYKVTLKTIKPLVLSEEEVTALRELNQLGAGLINPFTRRQLKTAHRRLALKFHPDTGGTDGSDDKFIQIQSWIKILEKRALETL